MSFAASVGRDIMLTARNSDLMFQINMLSQNIMQLSNVASRLVGMNANLQPGSPQARQLEAKQEQLKQVNKGLEMQLELVRTQQKAVTTELESVRKAISENIQSSFKTFANS